MGIFTDFITDVAILIEDVVDVVKDNPVKTTAVVATTVATGGLSLVAAPTIAATAGGAGLLGAASTGTAISSLSGAAATSASLAAFGGGAVAAGGAGVAGGTAVITAAGATTGAVAGIAATKS